MQILSRYLLSNCDFFIDSQIYEVEDHFNRLNKVWCFIKAINSVLKVIVFGTKRVVGGDRN